MNETFQYFGNIELPVREWENYGDVNPIEHGGIWIKPDVPTFPGCYYLVKNIPLDDRYGWWVQDGYIDLSDDWIEWDSVYSYAGIDWTTPAEIRAIAAFDYYGPLNFSGESNEVNTEADLLEALEEWEIEVK